MSYGGKSKVAKHDKMYSNLGDWADDGEGLGDQCSKQSHTKYVRYAGGCSVSPSGHLFVFIYIYIFCNIDIT